MLTQLKITNLALVDSLDWNLGDGLVSVTGETGAGKSVIVGALKLILGERADKSLIRTGETQCSVEAVFELRQPETVNALLADAGLEKCEDGLLIVKRSLTTTSNRQFLNNSPVTLSLLANIGQFLVDLHGPHDHQSLLSTERQMAMLDAFSGNAKLLDSYRFVYEEWKFKLNELEELQSSERASEQEVDLLKFQIEEIDTADLRPDEEEEIEERYKRSASAGRLVETAGAMSSLLDGGEGNVLRMLGELQNMSAELLRLDPKSDSMTGGLDSAVVELQELSGSLGAYIEDLKIDPEEAVTLEKRIDSFHSLKRKYGETLKDVLKHRETAAERLDSIENRGDRIEALRAEVDALRKKMDTTGKKLGSARQKKAALLSKEIVGHLQNLGFKQAQFSISLVSSEQPTSNGLEAIEFQFGPNPGEPLKALRQIASSGEMSRVMLAVKSALADQDATPLMVFDEIDANVGGEIAKAVGIKMAGLGDQHQVISITHFPQVAAVAKYHYVVDKLIENKRTISTLRSVEGEERVTELIRMLGGGGEQAKAMAESLLAESAQS